MNIKAIYIWLHPSEYEIWGICADDIGVLIEDTKTGHRLFIPMPEANQEMLKKYNQIDIALDPFPYSGVTTSLEANWMGVPLLTKKGNNFYSRIGTGINKNLDMEDWIANDEKDYINGGRMCFLQESKSRNCRLCKDEC